MGPCTYYVTPEGEGGLTVKLPCSRLEWPSLRIGRIGITFNDHILFCPNLRNNSS